MGLFRVNGRLTGREDEQRADHGRKLILQLHAGDAHERPHMDDPAIRPYGNPVLALFQDDVAAPVARARALAAEILEGPRVNANANHREIWLRGPDGSVVARAGAYGDL